MIFTAVKEREREQWEERVTQTDLQRERLWVRIDNSEVEGSGGKSGAGDRNHMIWRSRVHMAVYVEPDMLGGSLRGGCC